jgi:hypothetical protein
MRPSRMGCKIVVGPRFVCFSLPDNEGGDNDNGRIITPRQSYGACSVNYSSVRPPHPSNSSVRAIVVLEG